MQYAWFEVLCLECNCVQISGVHEQNWYHDPGHQKECKLMYEPDDFADSYNWSPQDQGCTGLCLSGIPAHHPA